MKRGILVALLACAAVLAKGQDIHFTQFYETSILRNPGLTGIYSQDYKVAAVYRSQWGSVATAFNTGMVSGEIRLPVSNNGRTKDYVTFGLLGYDDKAGKVGLKTVAAYPAINYNKALDDAHGSYLSVGFTGGLVQRSFDVSKATFDYQYQNNTVNPSLGAGEALVNPKLSYWDVGTGISFNSSLGEDNTTNYYLGVSGYHLNRPRSTFTTVEEDNQRLAARWGFSGGVKWGVATNWTAEVQSNVSLQGTYNEVIVGGILRYAPTTVTNDQIMAVSAGVFYRYNDAIAPMLKLEYKGQTFGISYDVNYSSLRTASDMHGGLECTAIFTGFLHAEHADKMGCPRM